MSEKINTNMSFCVNTTSCLEMKLLLFNFFFFFMYIMFYDSPSITAICKLSINYLYLFFHTVKGTLHAPPLVERSAVLLIKISDLK